MSFIYINQNLKHFKWKAIKKTFYWNAWEKIMNFCVFWKKNINKFEYWLKSEGYLSNCNIINEVLDTLIVNRVI
jgi:hypothetical protein